MLERMSTSSILKGSALCSVSNTASDSSKSVGHSVSGHREIRRRGGSIETNLERDNKREPSTRSRSNSLCYSPCRHQDFVGPPLCRREGMRRDRERLVRDRREPSVASRQLNGSPKCSERRRRAKGSTRVGRVASLPTIDGTGINEGI